MTIEPMHASDLEAVRALLVASGLPEAGLDAHIGTALVGRDGRRIVASAALEMHRPDALLRSVAVEASFRGRGAGQLMAAEAIALARRHGVRGLYLLTETAAPFFSRLGFVEVPREAVPEAVRQSIEFTTVCPASARAMALVLS